MRQIVGYVSTLTVHAKTTKEKEDHKGSGVARALAPFLSLSGLRVKHADGAGAPSRSGWKLSANPPETFHLQSSSEGRRANP